MTTTFAEAIDTADSVFRRAKQHAEVARLRSKASPADPELRVAASTAADSASDAGRRVHELRFEQELDCWIDSDPVLDENLVLLAPRVRGEMDSYWLAAAHLVAAGWNVPKGWRSPHSGEPINDHHTKSPSALTSGSAPAPR